MSEKNYVITINRQVGSGGKYLGTKLAERLNYLYLDHEIVKEAANDLETFVENLEDCDEKQSSIWSSLLAYSAFAGFEYVPPVEIVSESEAHKAQSNFITKIANEKSAVIIGRCGSYILRNHPRHVSIFLNADIEFRKNRIAIEHKMSEREALHFIEKVDKERAKYFKSLTGEDVYNICGYDLTINTGKIGFDDSLELIIDYLKRRFKDEYDNK